MEAMIKNINDQRAFSDMGTALFVLKSSGKYSLFLPVTDMPATGGAPDTLETTVTTSRKKTYIDARQDTPQKEYTFFPHRDNFRVLKEYYGKKASFLQVNADMTAWAFEGSVTYYQDSISTNGVANAKLVITPSSADELPIDNCLDLIEDTAIITNAINAIEVVKVSEDVTVIVETDPADATITAVSESTTVATATVASGKVTIAGVKEGSSVVTITSAKEGMASYTTTILVNVVA